MKKWDDQSASMQQLRDRIVEAQQAGQWQRVIMLKQRIVHLRKADAIRQSKKKAVPEL